jgi:hypothetical protein
MQASENKIATKLPQQTIRGIPLPRVEKAQRNIQVTLATFPQQSNTNITIYITNHQTFKSQLDYFSNL